MEIKITKSRSNLVLRDKYLLSQNREQILLGWYRIYYLEIYSDKSGTNFVKSRSNLLSRDWIYYLGMWVSGENQTRREKTRGVDMNERKHVNVLEN